MSVDRSRAHELFGPELAWIVDRLQARLERGRPLEGRLRLTGPTDAQRDALERLMGRRPATARSISVEVAELERILARAGIADGLVALVEALRGPVIDRAASTVAEQQHWTAVHERLRAEAAALHPALAGWADELAATGLLRRLAGDPDTAAELGRQAVTVLAWLPAGGVALAQLAATTLGDSHALDDDTSLATLVLRGIEATTGLPRRDRSAAERRAIWARVGVLLDELSAPALVAGLHPAGDGLLATTLRAHAAAGEPCRITLRTLVRYPADWTDLDRRVLVVENPTVVAAVADRCGPATPPLVCSEGQPSGAVQALLGQLVDAGATLAFHADFDAGGIRIGNLLLDRFGAVPWRMSRVDYQRASEAAGRPLSSSVPEASWDAELSAAMVTRGRAVHEEQLVVELADELARTAPAAGR